MTGLSTVSGMCRKSNSKLGAGITVDDVYFGLHCARQLLHQRQPDAGADGFAREFIFGAIKQLENLFHLIRIDAGAIVAHRELDLAILHLLVANLDLPRDHHWRKT